MGYKPLGRKSYGSIGHLPESRLGPGDHKITEGQARIATERARDKHDTVIVQEKLDGSNVGIARINDDIVPLTRAGYVANTSKYIQHIKFYMWAMNRRCLFNHILEDGERLCGEWLLQAHGTCYMLAHEPFVAFDIFTPDNKRVTYEELKHRIDGRLPMPYEVSVGNPLSINVTLGRLGERGMHGALEPIEGAVWRVERKGVVDFLCKYVRPTKVDGLYLPSISGKLIYNGYTEKQED